MTKILSRQAEQKCGGCNWEVSTLYSFDTEIQHDLDAWICGNCMIDLVSENNYDIDTRGIETE